MEQPLQREEDEESSSLRASLRDGVFLHVEWNAVTLRRIQQLLSEHCPAATTTTATSTRSGSNDGPTATTASAATADGTQGAPPVADEIALLHCRYHPGEGASIFAVLRCLAPYATRLTVAQDDLSPVLSDIVDALAEDDDHGGQNNNRTAESRRRRPSRVTHLELVAREAPLLDTDASLLAGLPMRQQQEQQQQQQQQQQWTTLQELSLALPLTQKDYGPLLAALDRGRRECWAAAAAASANTTSTTSTAAAENSDATFATTFPRISLQGVGFSSHQYLLHRFVAQLCHYPGVVHHLQLVPRRRRSQCVAEARRVKPWFWHAVGQLLTGAAGLASLHVTAVDSRLPSPTDQPNGLVPHMLASSSSPPTPICNTTLHRLVLSGPAAAPLWRDLVFPGLHQLNETNGGDAPICPTPRPPQSSRWTFPALRHVAWDEPSVTASAWPHFRYTLGDGGGAGRSPDISTGLTSLQAPWRSRDGPQWIAALQDCLTLQRIQWLEPVQLDRVVTDVGGGADGPACASEETKEEESCRAVIEQLLLRNRLFRRAQQVILPQTTAIGSAATTDSTTDHKEHDATATTLVTTLANLATTINVRDAGLDARYHIVRQSVGSLFGIIAPSGSNVLAKKSVLSPSSPSPPQQEVPAVVGIRSNACSTTAPPRHRQFSSSVKLAPRWVPLFVLGVVLSMATVVRPVQAWTAVVTTVKPCPLPSTTRLASDWYGRGSDIWPPANDEYAVQLSDSFPGGQVPPIIALHDNDTAVNTRLEHQQGQRRTRRGLFFGACTLLLAAHGAVGPLDVGALLLWHTYNYVLAQLAAADNGLPALPPDGHMPQLLSNPLQTVSTTAVRRSAQFDAWVSFGLPMMLFLARRGDPSLAQQWWRTVLGRPVLWWMATQIVEDRIGGATTRRSRFFRTTLQSPPLPLPLQYWIRLSARLVRWALLTVAVVVTQWPSVVLTENVVVERAATTATTSAALSWMYRGLPLFHWIWSTLQVFGFWIPVAGPKYMRAHFVGAEAQSLTVQPTAAHHYTLLAPFTLAPKDNEED